VQRGIFMKNEGGKRILIIEDDLHIAEGLKLNLFFKGYDAKIAPDGPSGLREWKEWKPKLIILDIMLPGIDGLSVLRNIRLEDERVPILILTAKSEPEYRLKGLSYGVDDYLSKPFNLDEFLLRVERLLMRAAMKSFSIFISCSVSVISPDRQCAVNISKLMVFPPNV